MFVTNWISTTKIQKISEITNFFRHYFLSRTEVYNYIKSELRNKFHFKTAEVDGKWATLKKGSVVVDVSVDGNAYGFTFYIK